MAVRGPAASGTGSAGPVATCRVFRWRGYVSSTFVAVDDAESLVAESGSFRWRGAADPPDEGSVRAAYDALVAELERQGWERAEGGQDVWFETVFVRELSELELDLRAQLAAATVQAPAPPEPAPTPPVAPPPPVAPAPPVVPVAPAPVPVAPTPPVAPAPAPVELPRPAPPAAEPAPPPPPRPRPAAAPRVARPKPRPAPRAAPRKPPKQAAAKKAPTTPPAAARKPKRRLSLVKLVAGAGALVATCAFVFVFLGDHRADGAHTPALQHAGIPLQVGFTEPASQRHHRPIARQKPKAAAPPLVKLEIASKATPSAIEIRRSSASGPVLYTGELPANTTLRFKGARLWTHLGAAADVAITANGRVVKTPRGAVNYTFVARRR